MQVMHMCLLTTGGGGGLGLGR